MTDPQRDREAAASMVLRTVLDGLPLDDRQERNVVAAMLAFADAWPATPSDTQGREPFASGVSEAGLGWSGFYVTGNKKSVDEVKRLSDSEAYYRGCTEELRQRLAALSEPSASTPHGEGEGRSPPQDFLDGYAFGFKAAKHPFHLPTVEEAWKHRDQSRANGHIPAAAALSADVTQRATPEVSMTALVEALDEATAHLANVLYADPGPRSVALRKAASEWWHSQDRAALQAVRQTEGR